MTKESCRRPITRTTAAKVDTMTDKTGVRKPMASETDISEIPAIRIGEEDPVERPMAPIRKVAATDIRSSSNATPGPP